MFLTRDEIRAIIHVSRSRMPRTALAAALSALLATVTLTQCGEAKAASPAEGPARIVAAGGAITEIIYAVGAQDRVVGVDSTSQYPADALRTKANIGYLRALSAEGVLSLRPDLLLASEGAGPPDTLKLLAEAKVPTIRVNEAFTAEGVVARIRTVADLVGEGGKGRLLSDAVRGEFDTLAVRRGTLTQRKRVLFVLALQNGRPMVAGRDTAAAAIIELAGGINAGETMEGYKPMTDEAVIAAAPDVVLMMDRGAPTPSASSLFGLPAFAATPAASSQGLVVMDGLFLLGFGPRTPAAAGELMRALYPATRSGHAAIGRGSDRTMSRP